MSIFDKKLQKDMKALFPEWVMPIVANVKIESEVSKIHFDRLHGHHLNLRQKVTSDVIGTTPVREIVNTHIPISDMPPLLLYGNQGKIGGSVPETTRIGKSLKDTFTLYKPDTSILNYGTKQGGYDMGLKPKLTIPLPEGTNIRDAFKIAENATKSQYGSGSTTKEGKTVRKPQIFANRRKDETPSVLYF